MNWIKAFLTLILTIGLIYLLDTKLGDIPPLGKFLNPFKGFWANAEGKHISPEQELLIPGLQDKVKVLFDDQLVPHIFAQNDHDLYFAQGYITAKHRLWQMEFQTQAAAGRISEIVGEKAIEFDRYQRRMGTVFGAERSLEAMLADPTSKRALEAYASGINAYIGQLSPKNYPLEYKLLNYAPEEWTPLKSALLLKQMAHTLTSGSDDLRMTNILHKYGASVVKDLFPNYPFKEDPIVPTNHQWDFEPLPVPKPPTNYLAETAEEKIQSPNPEIGSNNWAIGAEKSATGYPILANDPHLTLSLPSIWYQVQLVSPDVNVYGASLPGSPFIISGFNQKIAWGVTNVGADVLDWFEIKYKDASQKEYWHDNQWKPVKQRVEEIKIRGKASVFDTVNYTHHGPVVYEKAMKPFKPQAPTGRAMSWIALEPSNEVLTFYKLNRANNYRQYVEALSHYECPAQNFVFASIDKDIAIWSNGKFPLKWEEQGKFILDGTDPSYDWQEWIPQAHNPHVKNPARGFVSSANQFPADTTYPYYLGWEFEDYYRAFQINNRLQAMNAATADSLRLLQNDNLNILAKSVLPTLFSYVSKKQLTARQQKAYQQIASWDYRNDADAIGATIFTKWWDNLVTGLWQDEFGSEELPMRYPSRDRTVKLLTDEPSSPYIDNKETPEKESISEISTTALQAAIDTLYKRNGEIGEKWHWATVRGTDIMHLARIPALSRMDIVNGGGRGIVNATTETTGPSWRMIVALGPQVKGYGLYPGGQSGNPGSFYYDNMVEKWRKGELNELVYLQQPETSSNRIISSWTLNK